MDAHCSKCATPLTPFWIFCPHCGTAVPHETQNYAAPPEHVPARGAFSGLLYGLIAAPILIAAGIMISLTGWGVFLGVPVILLGILAPLAGPLFGMGETVVISLGDGKVHDCPTCSGRFAVGGHAAV